MEYLSRHLKLETQVPRRVPKGHLFRVLGLYVKADVGDMVPSTMERAETAQASRDMDLLLISEDGNAYAH
jgi:hypothetical protein